MQVEGFWVKKGFFCTHRGRGGGVGKGKCFFFVHVGGSFVHTTHIAMAAHLHCHKCLIANIEANIISMTADSDKTFLIQRVTEPPLGIRERKQKLVHRAPPNTSGKVSTITAPISLV